MRRLITILIAAAMTMTLLILKANGQGHGHGNGRGKGKHEWKNDKSHSRHESRGTYSYDRRDHHDNYRNVDHYYYSGHHHVYHHPVFAHNHSRHCGHAIVARHHDRPRYVFYSDYGVYYDYQRNVYISYSGRGWTVSASLPVHMHHVRLRDAVCHEVDYYDDNFIAYLDHGRPMHGRVIHMN